MRDLEHHRQLSRLVDEIYFQSDARGYTRTKLARKAGIHRTTVTKLGNFTTRFPRAQTVFDLARAVGIKISVNGS